MPYSLCLIALLFLSYLKTSVIGLSFVLALGFLLVIMSCALYGNWWPLFVVATYVLAPLPNAVFGRYAGRDDVMSDYQGGIADAGYFLTGLMIITGFCLPVVLAHAGVITVPAMIMSISGGLLIYGTSTFKPFFFVFVDYNYGAFGCDAN
ncbi:vacuolar protein sorting 55 [Linnemannia elongata AG-77]|uniref:Vacuolar protein sorting 55 n=1 Tax=Linnemannia elongata AG-77 TaxID=1314771 RepID=A0A197K1X2_9FUNG|nr:vacuolar protein sorting 55 [Linnemannia elongata AG-77]